MALWRGPALADAGPALAADAARLDAQRHTARLDLIEARIAAGQADQVVTEAGTLVADTPTDERAVAALMRALNATGRPAEALRAYESLRAALADELGTDPGPTLRALHLAVLRGESEEVTAAPADDEPVPRTNLPEPLTSFVGRDRDVVAIADALKEHRLVTLIGPGGSGKTRLAEEAGRGLVDQYRDGVWLIGLASVTDPAELPQSVLSALGQREIRILDRRAPAVGDAVQRLCTVLRAHETLLVLDNCEHLVDAGAQLAETLLARCPDLRILTTSREPLGVTGESLLRVAPLPQPEPDRTAAAADVEQYPAVRLFTDRAAAVRPDFVLDDSTAPMVSEIVRRLDGLPLAIELAAARLRTLPIDQIAARLSDRFRLLTGGSRTALPRHRTLRAVVEWSWDLLNDDERELAERAAVFPGGITLAGAVAVCEPLNLSVDDVSDLLAGLVDKSLLQLVGEGHRMRMLETLREYGTERLDERGVLGAVRRRHADYFAAVLDEATPGLYTRDQVQWLEVLDAERDNAVAALRFLATESDAEGALSIALALAQPALLRGSEADVGALIAEALAVPGDPDSVRRLLAEGFGLLTAFDSTVAGPGTTTERMRELAVRMADVDPTGYPLTTMLRAALAYLGDDSELASEYIEKSLTSADPWVAASALAFRENLHENQGDVESMRADLTEAHARFSEMGERWGLSNTLRGLAYVATLDGDLDLALDYYRQALTLMREMRSSDDEVFLRVRMADVYLRLGDEPAARAEIDAAARMADRRGGPIESAMTNAMLGHAARQAGDLEEATHRLVLVTDAIAAMGQVHPMRGHAVAFAAGLGANVALDAGDLDLARKRLAEATQASISTRDRPIQATIAVVIAEHALAGGEPGVAADWLGRAAVLRGAEDLTAPDITAARARAAEALGAAEFERIYDGARSEPAETALRRMIEFAETRGPGRALSSARSDAERDSWRDHEEQLEHPEYDDAGHRADEADQPGQRVQRLGEDEPAPNEGHTVPVFAVDQPASGMTEDPGQGGAERRQVRPVQDHRQPEVDVFGQDRRAERQHRHEEQERDDRPGQHPVGVVAEFENRVHRQPERPQHGEAEQVGRQVGAESGDLVPQGAAAVRVRLGQPDVEHEQGHGDGEHAVGQGLDPFDTAPRVLVVERGHRIRVAGTGGRRQGVPTHEAAAPSTGAAARCGDDPVQTRLR